MPKVSIRFAESPIVDLETIKSWYVEQGVADVGYRYVQEIIARIEVLRDNPEKGRIVPEFDQPFLRELIHLPFRIIYRRDPKHVLIVRV